MAASPVARPAVSAAASPAVSPAVWIVYRGETPLWWLRMLKPGFRHCLALLNDGRHWVAVDPLAGFTDVTVLDLPAGFDLPGWYRARGLTVDSASLRRPAGSAPWGPFTCVEAVKRLIGLQAPWILTPWQLHRHLTRRAAHFGSSPDLLPDRSPDPLPGACRCPRRRP